MCQWPGRDRRYLASLALINMGNATFIRKPDSEHITFLWQIVDCSRFSADRQSYTEIFPEGFFRYSPEQGFLGTAKKVLINERVKKGRQVQGSAAVTQTENRRSDTRENEKLLTKTRLKEKAVNTSNYIFWYLAGLVMIFAGVYFFRSVYRER